MPTTTAITNAQPGYEWTAGLMYAVIGLLPVSKAQLSNASASVITPKRAVTSHEKILPSASLTNELSPG